MLGYEGFKEPRDAEIRKRCQLLGKEIIDAAALSLTAYMQLSDSAEEDRLRARADAEILDKVSSQFLFAVGATEINEGKEPATLRSQAARQAYLRDNEETFQQVGVVGTPHTIYYLVQLLAYLTPADPGKVFDLVTNALLQGGKLHRLSIRVSRGGQVCKVCQPYIGGSSRTV